MEAIASIRCSAKLERWFSNPTPDEKWAFAAPCNRLDVNNERRGNGFIQKSRQFWVQVGWHPPKEDPRQRSDDFVKASKVSLCQLKLIENEHQLIASRLCSRWQLRFQPFYKGCVKLSA
jgi:hypothetical protein